MTKDFMNLVFFALLIALPAAGFMMNKWLNSYAYHISLNWSMFVIPAMLIFVIALVVISGEIIKAAWMNPVKSLRSE